MQQSSKKKVHEFVSEIYNVITFVTIIYIYIHIYIYEHKTFWKYVFCPLCPPHDINMKYHEHESGETPGYQQ